MWGMSNWGHMIWGGTSVPVLPFVGIMILLLSTAVLGARVLTRPKTRWPSTVLSSLVLLVPAVAAAATLVLPHPFVNGTIADADEVNSNFETVVLESDAQDARLVALEGAAPAAFSCSIESRVASGMGGQVRCTTAG